MYSDRDLVIDSILLLFMAVAVALWQLFSATRISIGFVCETRLSSVNNNYYSIVTVVLPI